MRVNERRMRFNMPMWQYRAILVQMRLFLFEAVTFRNQYGIFVPSSVLFEAYTRWVEEHEGEMNLLVTQRLFTHGLRRYIESLPVEEAQVFRRSKNRGVCGFRGMTLRQPYREKLRWKHMNGDFPPTSEAPSEVDAAPTA